MLSFLLASVKMQGILLLQGQIEIFAKLYIMVLSIPVLLALMEAIHSFLWHEGTKSAKRGKKRLFWFLFLFFVFPISVKAAEQEEVLLED